MLDLHITAPKFNIHAYRDVKSVIDRYVAAAHKQFEENERLRERSTPRI